ncbi:MAG: outer membrane lipoprotein chaperone LolA [Thermodesulfobacteriota bacterium]
MKRLQLSLSALSLRGSTLLVTAALCCLIPLLPLPAQADDLDGIVSRLQVRYETVHELSAVFTQSNLSKGMGASLTTSGKVYFKKPGMMRWEYNNADGDLLISDGSTIWLFQADLNQVIESSADGTGGALAHNFLAGMGRLRDDFDISLANVSPKKYRLDLSPKVEHPSIARLSIDVDRATFLVTGTTVLDRFGNETMVTFSGMEIDRGLEPSLFTYTPPEGVIVVSP